jgi:peptide methionine sulfoxide reductase msrA/msrB
MAANYEERTPAPASRCDYDLFKDIIMESPSRSDRRFNRRSNVSTLVLSGLLLAGCQLAGCQEQETQKEMQGVASGEATAQPERADRVVKSDAEWRRLLTPEQYRVTRRKGTERAFTGAYHDLHAKGTYKCVCCGQALFASESKFDSGTGWPSFFEPKSRDAVEAETDRSLGMERTEVLCSRCAAHLGHVFKDGPEPTGDSGLRVATFGAGCFWCTEAAFESLPGVKSVTVGYAGGHTADPTYEQVCTGETGHAEVARIVYDPSEVSFDRLLEVFWQVHDPTSLNRQGADVGTQYRSVILYHSPEQKEAAERAIAALGKKLGRRVVTELSPAAEFYEAEPYHQDYYANHPDGAYSRRVIAPKLKKRK